MPRPPLVAPLMFVFVGIYGTLQESQSINPSIQRQCRALNFSPGSAGKKTPKKTNRTSALFDGTKLRELQLNFKKGLNHKTAHKP